jgi:hypothetical protein
MQEAMGPVNTVWGLTGAPTWNAMARQRADESIRLRLKQLRDLGERFGPRGKYLAQKAGVPKDSKEVEEIIHRTESH